MLKLINVHANIEDKPILKGVHLTVDAGETHAIMGPNGSGKSTLAKLLAGHPEVELTEGEIYFEDERLDSCPPHERALKGLFLAFQYPMEIPGLTNSTFLKEALNARRRFLGESELDAFDFLEKAKSAMKALKMDERLLHRPLNEGFSGGEKKANEILQCLLLAPQLAILDETDSGLDIDTLKTIAQGLNAFQTKKNARLLITHYQRLLDYIKPDKVHVFMDGTIKETGDFTLTQHLEKHGYANWL